jgi:hypothetical protein
MPEYRLLGKYSTAGPEEMGIQEHHESDGLNCLYNFGTDLNVVKKEEPLFELSVNRVSARHEPVYAGVPHRNL